MLKPVKMVDLGLLDQTVTVGCWLAPVGATVLQGDAVLELLAGEVVIDVPSPATGKLAEKRVAEGDLVTAGQVVGVIEADDD